MFKKKLLAIAASAALVIPAFSMPTSAANPGDLFKVGDTSVKLATDFESFPDGEVIGQDGDAYFTCADNLNTSNHCNIHIADKTGIDSSKGLVFGVKEGIKNDGEFVGFQYLTKKSGVIDFEGADSLVFWVDCTKETNSVAYVQTIWSEYDCDNNGNFIMTTDPNTDQQVPKITQWHIADDITNVYYIYQDGNWVERDSTTGFCLQLPNTFSGYVKIPFACLEPLSSSDTDNKFDMKHVTSIGFYTGIYPRHLTYGQNLTFDNIGFGGTFTDETTVSTETSDTSTVATDTQTTSETTASSVTSVSTTSSNTASPSTTASTKASTTASTTASATVVTSTTATTVASVSDTTNAPSDTTATTGTESPKTGAKPITAALATAVILAGVLVVTKKKDK